VIGTVLVVVGAVASILLRTRSGAGTTTDFGVADGVILAGLAAVSLGLVGVCRHWRIWSWQCVLAVLGWLPFLGPAGDMSCTDCAFALLIPMNLLVGQFALLVVGLTFPDLRRQSDGAA